MNKMKRGQKVNYLHFFLLHMISFFVLWILPFLFGKYADSTFPYVAKDDITDELVGLVGPVKNKLNLCPRISPLLRPGYQLLSYDVHYLMNDEKVSRELNIAPGGTWKPSTCQALYEVVIVVPYRDRAEQLNNFLQYMHPYLQRQQVNYRIVVVEQNDKKPFNRGILLNVGYKETLKLGSPHHCFIFHDVDLLPQNDFNIYACTHQPRHLITLLDTFRYHLPYRRIVGGAIAMQSIHFEEINGFSNVFNGWGGEDDDLYSRLEEKGLTIIRFDPKVASYVMLPHQHAVPSPNRWDHLAESLMKLRGDGLSTVKYKVDRHELRSLYTYYLVSI